MKALIRCRLILILLNIFLPFAGFAQAGIREYVKTRSVEVKSIEAFDSFTDLEPFGAAIGDAKIVLLGEQSHGDATTFQAKSRIVQYLHQQKGFEGLVFESDFFSLQQGISLNADSLFLRNNIFPIWTWCNTCKDLLYNYIPSTFKSARPLFVTGMDPQLHGDYAVKNLSENFNRFIDSGFAGDLEVLKIAQDICKDIDSLILFNSPKDTVTCTRMITNIDLLLANNNIKSSAPAHWVQYLRNFRMQARVYLAHLKKNHAEFYIRDMQMAENIDWLLNNTFKGKKIIVWAHNYHISKNSYDRFNPVTGRHLSMGSFLAHEFNREKEMYILGFTSFNGFTDWTNSDTYDQVLRKPQKNGYENWIPVQWPYAFTDFKPYNESRNGLVEQFHMKGSTYLTHASTLMSWSSVFDGVFFVRDMKGCIVQ
jgi:erythromycin esterase-like protein